MNNQNGNQQFSLEGVVRIQQIIIMAMAAGAMMFTVVVVVIGQWQPQNFDILTMMSIFIAFPNLIASFVVPRIIVNAGRSKIHSSTADPTLDDFASLFQSSRIIGAALCEGTVFFAAVTYMVEGHYAALIVAVVGLAALLLRFPTLNGTKEWAEEQLRMRV